MPNIRIISGKIGGRNLKTSDNKNLRPTPAKMREQLFSWLRPLINDFICLEEWLELFFSESLTFLKNFTKNR